MPGLLHLRSRYPGDMGEPELLDPRGVAVPDPTAYLRGYLGRDDVQAAREEAISHFDQLPLSILTTATLDWVRSVVPNGPVDERRFRPNLLVRTPPGTPPFVEDERFGNKARIANALCVEFVRSSERCVTINEAQQDLPHSPSALRAITHAHNTSKTAPPTRGPGPPLSLHTARPHLCGAAGRTRPTPGTTQLKSPHPSR
ncbi:MOSC domain-containing protein [Streptomyces sp. CEV 2-1]|uniref:MOSC domain-containing protein n=2 Tax=unclassified Streptomyces TaxID=2593676 RepID=UPI002889F9B0|nr:MOSC domain-containing protein [Streptomyces sp. CEV 2-1]